MTVGVGVLCRCDASERVVLPTLGGGGGGYYSILFYENSVVSVV